MYRSLDKNLEIRYNMLSRGEVGKYPSSAGMFFDKYIANIDPCADTVKDLLYSFRSGIFIFKKGSDLKYDCGRMLSRRDRQAYCLYIRQPLGRRITNSFSGQPPNPHQNDNRTWTAVLRYRRKRGSLQPRIKPKWSLCGSPKATTTALKEDPKKQI